MIKPQTTSAPQPAWIAALADDTLFITPYTDSFYNEAEELDTHDDLFGDDYADAILADLNY